MRDLGLLALALATLSAVASIRALSPPPRLAALTGDQRRRTGSGPRRLEGFDRRCGAALAARAPRVARSVADRLAATGAVGRQELHDHLGRRARLVAIGVAVGLVVLAQGSGWVLVLAPTGAWLAADGALDAAARRRVRRIEAQLPDFLDVVAVVLSAGLGFDDALARVAEAMPGPIADEVERARQQLDLGASRAEAHAALRGRTGAPSFDAFVAALVQAEELGAPLADATIALAADVRRGAAQAARRRAAQAAPRVSLVLTTVIVPAALVLLLAGLVLGSGVDLGPAFGA